MYCRDRMRVLRAVIIAARLKTPEGFKKIRLSALVCLCNGVGPEHFPKFLRKLITWFLRSAQGTAVVHDLQYHNSDGSREGRSKADKAFAINGVREAFYIYWWFDPRAYVAACKALLAYLCLRRWGEKAWQDAFLSNQKKEKTK